MAAATAGRVHNIHTLAEAYCNLIMACTSAGEWERATEWCEMVDEFARKNETAPLFGSLPFGARRRAVRHRPLARGRAGTGGGAGDALRATCRRWARPPSPRWPSCGCGRAGSPRPSSCCRGREEHPSSLRALALLRTRRVGPRRPSRCSSAGCSPPRVTPCGPPSCWRRSSTRASPAATWRGRGGRGGQLAELAAECGHPAGHGPGRADRARVARGPAETSRRRPKPARRALAEFLALAMPLDAGEARLELAHALAAKAPDAASTRPAPRSRPSASWAPPGPPTRPPRCCASSAAAPAGGPTPPACSPPARRRCSS